MQQQQPSQSLGAPIPNNTPHAVSVTLPTWEATVGYEQGQDWVVQKMHSGYPRFFIHAKIQELCDLLEQTYARDGERCFIFPTYNVAKRCRSFMKDKTTLPNLTVRILQLSSPAPKNAEEASYRVEADIAVVFFPGTEYSLAKQYWQHSGEVISSREAEYFLSEMKDKLQSDARTKRTADQKKPSPHPYNSSHSHSHSRSPGRSSRSSRSSGRHSTINNPNGTSPEFVTFIEERFGRNLDLSFAKEAKRLLRERIATQSDPKYTNTDLVYLYPSGMASVFNAHQVLLHTLTDRKDCKSVCFGFPYVDTLNILKKWGAGVHFYGFGDEESLDEFQKRLETGEKILGLFCECPSNPMLTTPDLKRIHALSEKYDFAVVVDDTVGNASNIEVIPYCDLVVSSLTKVFSGDSNVMAGSMVVNRQSRYFDKFKKYLDDNYEDCFWDQDAIFLERNSRDFVRRSKVMNSNALAVLKLFTESPLIDKTFYPSIEKSREYYDAVKKPDGGYGALISVIFNDSADAVCFFNTVRLSKGPSLGTNFTLVCPYAILAHYQELDEVEKWGVDRNMVRLSIGMEPEAELIGILREALNSAQEQHDL
ncbi:DEKNAAC105229 [Brettanomyces naardenensis]|uniref:DEKNAAC105229 n=1 Tax=Brettanomyces naardenensis TaxID=13370 RepID=A0A448YT19_BRENA|nr:DEKNAAC105229 [Brettanomyces naardenensis]